MKALHPSIPVIAAGLILIGTRTVGPGSMVTDPVAVSAAPAMTEVIEGDRTAQDNSNSSNAMTPGPKWGPVFRSNSDRDRFPRVPDVTAAGHRSPYHQSNDPEKQHRVVKQPAMLSPTVRLETAAGQVVRVRNDDELPAAMQRMMHSNAASVA